MEALNSKKPPPGSPSPAERIIPITILTGSHSATKPPPSSSGSASKSSNKEGKGDGGQVDSRRQSLIVTFDDGTEIETQGVVTSLGTTASNGTNGQQGGSDSSRVKRNSRNCDALKIEEIGKETLRREIRNRSRSSSREKADRNKPETPTKVRIVPIRLSDGKVLTRDPDETMEIRTEFTNYTHTEYPDGSSAASPIPIPKEEKRRRRRSTSQTKTTTTETVTKTTERIVPITLANGDNFMPKFTTLDDLEPPEWSAFSPKNRAQNTDQKETVVPIRMEQQQQQQQQQHSRRYDHQRDSLLLDRKLNSGDARKRHSSGYSSSSVPNTTNVASSPPTSSILSNKREEFISTTIPPSTFSPTAVPDVTKSNNIPTSSATNSSSTSSSSDNNPRSSSSRESTPIRSSRKTSLTKSTTKTKETSRRETSSEKKHTVRFDMTADIADTPSRRRRQQFAQQVRSSSLDSSRSGVDGYQRQASPSPAVKARQRHPSSPATEKALNEIDADIHKIWLDLQELDRLPKDNKQHQPRSSTLPPKTSYASLSSPLVRPPPSHPPLVKPHPSTTVTPQRGATATPSPIATPVKVRTYNTPKPRVASANTHSIVLSTKPPHPPAYSSQHPSSVNHINPASLSSSNSSSSSNSASLPVGSPTYNPRRDLEPTKPGSIQPLGGVRRIVTTAAPGGSGGAHAPATPLATSVTVTSVQVSYWK